MASGRRGGACCGQGPATGRKDRLSYGRGDGTGSPDWWLIRQVSGVEGGCGRGTGAGEAWRSSRAGGLGRRGGEFCFRIEFAGSAGPLGGRVQKTQGL